MAVHLWSFGGEVITSYVKHTNSRESFKTELLLVDISIIGYAITMELTLMPDKTTAIET